MVMVSHDHEFIFLKTRKTAGTSVEMFLQPFCAPPGHPVVEQTHTLETHHGVIGMRLHARPKDTAHPDMIWYNHMSANAVHENLGKEKWYRYLKITTIRDPFDSMISRFHYVRGWKGLPTLPNDLAVHREAFRDFVLNKSGPNDEDIVFEHGNFAPDILVRYEHLENDLEKLCEKLKLDTSLTRLPKTKVTAALRNGFSISDYYDDETISAVVQKLRWYFEKGGYARHPKPA